MKNSKIARLVVILSGLSLMWVGVRVVQAHAILVSADPQPNSVVNTSPEEVWLLFSEPIEPAFSEIAVFAQTGQRVDDGDLTPADDDNTAMIVTLPRLAEGTYLVSWQVLSTVDGHTTNGTFPFGVGVGEISSEVGAVSSSAQDPTPFSVGGRWLTLTGITLLLGLFAFRLGVWQPLLSEVQLDEVERQLDQSMGRWGLKIGAISLGLLGLGLLLTFISQATQYDLLNNEFAKLWLGTRFGSMWFIRFALTLVFVIHLLYLGQARPQAGWVWWAGLALAVALTLTVSLVSHSAALTTDDALLALLVDFAHVLAAGVWVGGLLPLSLALWLGQRLPSQSRLWLYEGLAVNFSTLAAGVVGVLLLSGGYLAGQHVGSWTLLFGTAYGLTLLVKIGLALPAFGIAAVNLLVIKPRLKATTEAEREVSHTLPRRFTRLAQVETLFALLVLGAAGYLTDLQRGQDAPLLVDEPGKVLFESAVADLNIILSLEPALVGQNQFEVYLQDAAGQPVDNASEVSLRFTFLGQSMGTATAETTPVGEGRYTVTGGYISLIGPWQVEVSIRRPDTFDTFAPFRMEAGLGGTIRSLGNETWLERLTKFLSQSGGSVTGVLLLGLGMGWAFLASRAAKRDWQLVPLLLPGFVALGLGVWQIYTFYEEFTPARFTTNPILPDSGSLARGKQLYETNCATCHGLEGRGDGQLAANFFPPPVNFTDGHTDTHPDGDVYFWIKEGMAGSAMPAFGKQLSDEDLWHLVNYVRRLSAQQ